MNRTIAEIQKSLAKALNAMPGVFSTVQWGGRAYKLPGPGSRGMKKPVLLTHVCLNKAEDAVCLGFRLEKPRARAVTRQHPWIKPNSFGTLKNTGWVETEIRTKADCKVIIALLRESRTLHPIPEPAKATKAKASRSRGRKPDAVDDADARRIDSVLQRKRAEGWRPAQRDAFDD